MFHDVLSGVKEMVAAKPVSDGQTTHPLPLLGLYVTLYKAFLSASQAWCVYPALGAYPWHWLFEPAGASVAEQLIGASGRNSEGQTHCTGPLEISPRAFCSAVQLSNCGPART